MSKRGRKVAQEVLDDLSKPEDGKVKRQPVDWHFTALNWSFLKWMAKIPPYAVAKYGSYEQYREARLLGEKSPPNHIAGHLQQYLAGETYDHFDGDVRWHLVAIAYNAMMEWYYVTKFGWVEHPLNLDPIDVVLPRGPLPKQGP